RCSRRSEATPGTGLFLSSRASRAPFPDRRFHDGEEDTHGVVTVAHAGAAKRPIRGREGPCLARRCHTEAVSVRESRLTGVPRPPGARFALLHGSRARGTERPHSELDTDLNVRD